MTVLRLTAEQSAALRPLLMPGRTLIGRVTVREWRPGMDADADLEIDLGNVPSAALPAMRAVVKSALEDEARAMKPGRRVRVAA